MTTVCMRCVRPAIKLANPEYMNVRKWIWCRHSLTGGGFFCISKCIALVSAVILGKVGEHQYGLIVLGETNLA